MSFRKKGAVNWTIGKLINIVLLTVIMALLIYGITTGGLNPLIKNVENKFDEILIMLNFKDDVLNEKCFSADVSSVGGGVVFLNNIGLEKNIVLNVCRNRMCNFTGGLEEYRVDEGVFEKLEGGEWNIESDLFASSLDDVRFNRELYRGVSDILEKSEGLDFLTRPEPTTKFVLTGTPDGIFGVTYPMVATWQNNIWVIEHGDLDDKFYEDDNVAIDKFANKVRGGNDDEVSYDDGSGDKSIWRLVGNEGWFGSKNELDDDKEVARLKVEFAEKKAEYLLERYPSDAKIKNLTEFIDEHNEVVIDGKTFDMGVKNINDELVITLVSGELKFGLKYMLRGGYEDIFNCGRSSLPLVLVEWDDSWEKRGNEGYYKLNEACFENVYRESLTSVFLKSKCR